MPRNASSFILALVVTTGASAEMDDQPPGFAGRLFNSRAPVYMRAVPRPAGQQPGGALERQRIRTIVPPATLVALIRELAGSEVTVPRARVVGVFNPQAFLIESDSTLSTPLGHRDRIVVLLQSGRLQVPADLIVESTVTVFGVARTLLGLRATADVAWPDQLDRKAIEHLEVRAGIMAVSVQTPEGDELTDRPVRTHGILCPDR
jgi:hypothetical protein